MKTAWFVAVATSLVLAACGGSPAPTTKVSETPTATAELSTPSPTASEPTESPDAEFDREDVLAYCELRSALDRIDLARGELFTITDPAAAEAAAEALVADADALLEAATELEDTDIGAAVRDIERNVAPLRDAAARVAAGEATVADIQEAIFAFSSGVMAARSGVAAVPGLDREIATVCQRPADVDGATPPPVTLPTTTP